MHGRSWVCFRCLSRSPWFAQPRQLNPWRPYSTATAETTLSPVLLARARALTDEHALLSAKQVEAFDVKLVKRVGELESTVRALKDWDKANESLSELQMLIQDPTTDPELRSLAVEDLETTTSSFSSLSTALKKALIPRHPFADLPCLIEIRPGAGGDEAGIFASELLRMYISFCARHGLQPTILKKERQDVGGAAGSDEAIAEAVMEVEKPGSYDLLRTESGVHRVQRVPATETKGRTHTSAVSVMVLPSFPDSAQEDSRLNSEDPSSDYYIDPQDVQSEKFRAGGAGGQHVNKTESAVRLTHIPTGTVVSMQDSRSQHENRRKAWQLLRAKIAQARREAREQEMLELRRGVMGGVDKMGRGDKIRTYNFSQNRCTDHRSGKTVHSLGKVMDGGESLETIMDNVRNLFMDQEVEALCIQQQVGQNKPKLGKSSKQS